MKNTLHKRLLVVLAMIFVVVSASAQEEYVVSKNSTNAFYVKNTQANSYTWAVYSPSDLNTEIKDNSIFEFVSGTNQHRVEIVWHQTGDYILTVAEFNPCQNLKFVKVKVKEDDFNVTIEGGNILCSGQTLTLKAVVSKAGNYTYLWSDGSTKDSLVIKEAGDYSVTVTDTDSGNKATASISITLSQTPIVDLGEDYTLAEGEVKQLDAGNPGCTYAWNTGSKERTINVDKGGTYSVVVTNSAGCSASDEIIIYDANSVFTIDLGVDRDICEGDEIVLNPNPSIEQEYTYLWSTGATTATLTVSPKTTTKYSVTVTDSKGNKQFDEVLVTVHAAPIVDLGDDIYIKEGETVTLDAGNPGCKYEWITPNGKDNKQIVVADKQGVYSVLVTNEYGCSSSDDVRVYISSSSLVVDLAGNMQICEDDKIYIEPVVSGDFQSAPTYKWTPSGETSKGISVSEAGEYCVEVTADGETVKACMNLTLIPKPVVELGEDKVLNENGDPVILDAGNAGSFYEWNTGDITQTISVNQIGLYSVTVTSPEGCEGSDEVYISYPGSGSGGKYFVGFPTAFTPNGDGKNDVLYVRGNNIVELKLVIRNRLGLEVFRSNSMSNGWDGTYKGVMQDMDAYVYFLKAVFVDGKVIEKRGSVTLLR